MGIECDKMNPYETMRIKIKVATCPECKGTGKTQQNEYTPPFESFMGECKTCKGVGKVQLL